MQPYHNKLQKNKLKEEGKKTKEQKIKLVGYTHIADQQSSWTGQSVFTHVF